MSGTLHLQVVGGLCSRLRTILAAMGYCDTFDKRLVVDWPRAAKRISSFDARPDDLWADPPWEVTHTRRRFSSVSLIPPDAPGDVEVYTWKISTFGDPQQFKSHLAWYFGELRPSAEVAEFAGKWWSQVTRPVVGVVLRSTIPHADFAPPAWFIGRLTEIMGDVPDVSFYLATGSAEVRRDVMARFPSRTLSPQPRKRYDRAAIVQQAANLQVLMKTDWVVGTNRSSFAQMVAFARGGVYEGPEDLCRVSRGTGGYEDLWNRPEDRAVHAALVDARYNEEKGEGE